jgi:polygalacturonase
MASLSLPSNPHEIGDASHVTDHNLIVSNLSVLVGAVVNVQTYGAVGDGTTDDAAAFNAALAACAVGGTVFVPPAPAAII